MLWRLRQSTSNYNKEYYNAFYSSAMGGIVTDAELMMLPIDDELVHKGYGVSEVVLLRRGYLYMLEEHVDRLMEGCDAVGLDLPFSEPAIKRILLDVAAASRKMNGMVRFWVTPGRGAFTPLSTQTSEAGFYALAISDLFDIERTEGWAAVSMASPSAVPVPFAPVPGNQHLTTSVAQRMAAAEGAQAVIFTDPEGFVQQCSGYNLCITNKRDVLVMPPCEHVPMSVTLTRMLELFPAERERWPTDVVISDVQQRRLHISEVQQAKECFVVCSTYTVAPIHTLDGKPIADGKPGITTLALHYMLDNDLIKVPSPNHTQVPYGYMTGMRDQLV